MPTQTGDAQAALRQFWKSFHDQAVGTQVTTILDTASASEDPFLIEGRLIDGDHGGSYEAAKHACIRRVRAIVRECERNNEQFTDPEFNMKCDFYNKERDRYCLRGLSMPPEPNIDTNSNGGWDQHASDERPSPPYGNHCDRAQQSGMQRSAQELRVHDQIEAEEQPKSVHRVGEIFTSPFLAPGSAGTNLAAGTQPAAGSRWPWLGSYLLSGHVYLLTAMAVLQLASLLYIHQQRIYLLATAASIFCLLRFVHLLWNTARYSGPSFGSSEIQQSLRLGDCWFLSAVASLGSRNDLLQRLCVAWHQNCGVYGFVFYRDGQWTYTVVDDYLYLTACDFAATANAPHAVDRSKGQLYRSGHQTGSSALHFAKCRDQNQFWLPLLEKAYAKLHGDYSALIGGWADEGLEDLTGGVASVMRTDSVLDRDRLWTELHDCSKDYVFALGSPSNYDGNGLNGVVSSHAYSIEAAVHYPDISALKQVRVLRVRNPWGVDDGLWRGAFSKESKEWTTFASWWFPKCADAGVFYISFEEVLQTFARIYRTRVFDQTWTMQQSWAKLIISWTPAYNKVYFLLTLSKASEAVLSLSQLNKRHFRGLEGRHVFHLEFLVRMQGSAHGEFIARATAFDDPNLPRLSVSMEKTLPAGIYEVLVKVTALNSNEDYVWGVEDMVAHSTKRPKKLQQIARNYEIAHQKLVDINPQAKDFHMGSCSMISDPTQVAWNAVCGVGLRVFSKDPEMQLELRHRDADDVEKEGNEWARRDGGLGCGGRSRANSNDGWAAVG